MFSEKVVKMHILTRKINLPKILLRSLENVVLIVQSLSEKRFARLMKRYLLSSMMNVVTIRR